MKLYPRSKRSLLLCCAYIPSSKLDFYEYLTLECEKGFLYVLKVLIVGGDINSNSLTPKLPECKLLNNFINAFDLCEMFNGHTQITESTSSYLDVFLSNCSFAFADVLVKPIRF